MSAANSTYTTSRIRTSSGSLPKCTKLRIASATATDAAEMSRLQEPSTLFQSRRLVLNTGLAASSTVRCPGYRTGVSPVDPDKVTVQSLPTLFL